RHADQARTGAQRRRARQLHGAGHAVVAADHQHMTVVALVVVACTRRQVSGGQQSRVRQHMGVRRGRHAQGRQLQRTEMIGRTAGMQAALVRNEADRDMRANCRAGTLPAVGVQPGRNIQRQNGYAAGVDAPDQARRSGIRFAIEADAVQRIHVQLGFGQTVACRPRMHATATLRPCRARGDGIPPGSGCQGHQFDVKTGLARQHAEQETIATIVARAAVNADPAQLRPVSSQAVQGGAGGTLHQLDAGDVQRRQRRAIDLAHALDGIEVAAVLVLGHAVDYRATLTIGRCPWPPHPTLPTTPPSRATSSAGRSNWASPRRASAAPSWAKTSSTCSAGSPGAIMARWNTWHATAPDAPARPSWNPARNESSRCAWTISRPARRTPGECWTMPKPVTCRVTRWGAIITS